MKCVACGADLSLDAKACPNCGRTVTTTQRAEGDVVKVAEKTGEVAGKVGRGLMGVGKGIASGAKKGFKGHEEEKKE